MSKRIKEILTDRQEQYGDALENFEKIGKIWAALLGVPEPIKPWQVALMMDSLKTARLFANPNHTDSWLDKAGYTELGQDIVNR